jgi:hypothetical protein
MSQKPPRKHLFEGLNLDADEEWQGLTGKTREEAEIARANRMLSDCVVLGGYGQRLQPRARVDFLIDEKEIRVYRAELRPFDQRTPVVTGLIDADTRIEVGGRGEVKSGTEFIGGGIGLGGAAIGVAAAAVLNALTTRTSTETIISVTASGWQVIVLYGGMKPQDTRIGLAPVFGRIAAAEKKGRADESGPHDAVRALQALVELRDAGSLSEDEFAEAKRKVLDTM